MMRKYGTAEKIEPETPIDKTAKKDETWDQEDEKDLAKENTD